jgi:hypothetical protein
MCDFIEYESDHVHTALWQVNLNAYISHAFLDTCIP